MANEKSGFLYTSTAEMTKYRAVLDSVKSETHIHSLHTTRLLLERLVDGTVAFLGTLRLGMPKVAANGAQPVAPAVSTNPGLEEDDEVDAGSEPPGKQISINASAADMKNPAVIAAMEALRKAGLSADIVEPKYPAASP